MVMSVIIKKTQLKSIGKSPKLRKKNEEVCCTTNSCRK